ncbi:MAG: hypothetical protein JXQ85_10970 [Cognatishimia sp.]|uniref:hypothetical protein n=1 Tax=Cognatishimia sp. TaxID=2211648 RepID=UPI003B8B44EE
MTFAIAYLAICLGVILFHVAIIAGAPWGELTQGGRQHGRLDRQGRITALVAIVITLAMVFAVLSAAGGWPNWPTWLAYPALAMQGLSTYFNCITPSMAERKLWAPITVFMFALAFAAVFF